MIYTTTSCKSFNHPEFTFVCDPVIIPQHDIQWLIRTLERMVASGTRFREGDALPVGSMVLRCVGRGDMLELTEPDLTSLPIQYIESVNNTLLILKAQNDALKSAGLLEEQKIPGIFQRLITCSRFKNNTGYTLTRTQSDQSKGDSGWFIGCDDRSHDHHDPANQYHELVYEIYTKYPHIIPFLSFPPDTMISFNRRKLKELYYDDEKLTVKKKEIQDIAEYIRDQKNALADSLPIRATREKFESIRATLTKGDKKMDRLNPPDWVAQYGDESDFYPIYRDQDILYEHGNVVWGVIVMANTALFKPGGDNYPAATLYSPDPYFDGRREELQAMASQLFRLKDKPLEQVEKEDPELVPFSEVLTDQRTIKFHWRVPRSIAGDRQVYYSTLLIHREHIPSGYLVENTFPLIILPEQSPAAFIIPHRYWSRELLQEWGRF